MDNKTTAKAVVAFIAIAAAFTLTVMFVKSKREINTEVRVIEPQPGVKCFVLRYDLDPRAIHCLDINSEEFIPHGDF